jgi:DNA-binding transcriptional LysR family regulator
MTVPTHAQARATGYPSGRAAADGPRQLPLSRLDVRLLELAAQGVGLADLARTMELRPAAVERHLARLDRSAGMPLTRRNHQAVRLTSAGSRMLAAGRRFFTQVDQALLATIHGLGPEAPASPQVLAITTADPVVEDVVEEVATQLGMFLAVSHAAPDQALLHFDAYRADAVYTWWFDDPRIDLRRSARVHATLSEPLWAYLPRDHPQASQDTVSLASLTSDAWVSEAGPGSEPAVARVFRAVGLPVPGRLHTTSASVARGMLGCGGAVGLGTALSPGVTQRSVRCLPIEERPSRSAGLIVDPSLVSSVPADRLGHTLARRHHARAAERDGRSPGCPCDTGAGARDGAITAPENLPGTAPPGLQALDEAEFQLLQAVAQHGSINRAAAVLSISQSALTRRVHRLERRIGAPLLRRGSHGTALTGPAQQFLHQLIVLEHEFREAVGAQRPGYSLPASAMRR